MSLFILSVLAPRAELIFTCLPGSRIQACLKESHSLFQSKELNCYLILGTQISKKNDQE